MNLPDAPGPEVFYSYSGGALWRLTGRTRGRRGWFGRVIMQVEAFRGPASRYALWRDARADDLATLDAIAGREPAGEVPKHPPALVQEAWNKRLLPSYSDLRKIKIEPGDRFVLQVREKLSAQSVERLRDAYRQWVGGDGAALELLIIDGGMQMSICHLGDRSKSDGKRALAAARRTASPEGRREICEADWPRLASEILELSLEPQRVLVGGDLLDLEMRCALAGFDVGEIALAALRKAWSHTFHDRRDDMNAALWQSFVDRLILLSREDSDPARLALFAPSRAWSKHAKVLVSVLPKDDAPDGVKRGRAE